MVLRVVAGVRQFILVGPVAKFCLGSLAVETWRSVHVSSGFWTLLKECGESDMLVKRVVSAHCRLYAVAVLLLLIDIGLSGNQFGYEHRYRAWNTESEDSD